MPSSMPLSLSALTASLTAALFGYSVGFIGGIIVLPSFLNHFDLSQLSPSLLASAQARIVTFWLVGAFFGVPFGMPICSKWGRKPCLSFSAGLYVAGAVLQLCNFGNGRVALRIFELGRALNGLGVGCGTLVSPMYISEISPPSARAMLMSGYQTILQISALAGFWGAYFSHSYFPLSSALQYSFPIAIQLVPSCLLLLGTIFVIPETPRFLAEKGRIEDAEKSLAWLRGAEQGEEWMVSGEMEEIRDAVDIGRRLKEKSGSFAKEVLKNGVRRRLVVGVGLMIAQNMVGLNALNYYAPVIFASAGFTSLSSTLFLTGIFGIIKLISALLFMFIFVRIYTNRFWLLFGSALCAICMLVLAYFVANTDVNHDTSLTIGGIISVLTVYIFAFSFSVSLGPISWNVCAEIFPLHINATCCAITTSTQWAFQILIASLTPPLLASIGYLTYIIYAFFCILTYLFVYLIVPETRNVALGMEMDAIFNVNFHGDEDAEIDSDVDESSSLLGGMGKAGVIQRERVMERGRRGSFGAYT